jgi:hypothetical protein
MNEDEEEGNHGRSAGVGLWGFASMMAIGLSWERKSLDSVDDPARSLQLV